MEDNSDLLYQQLLHWLQNKSPDDSAFPKASLESEESDLPTEGQDRGPSEPLDSMLEAQLSKLSAIDDDVLSLMEDPLNWELEDWEIASQFGGSAQFAQLLATGEIPIVQKRFQALLKRRLQAEIKRHPPRFPWETEISDYQPEYSDEIPQGSVPAPAVWVPQLTKLLPVQLPENILSTLLNACTEAVDSLKPPEAKTVNAASSLFPDRVPALNEIAGRIRLSLAPGRRPVQEQERQLQELKASLPQNYQTATSEQQMVISLLAAREIIETLTLTLSDRQPVVQRQWQTVKGLVRLQAEYPSDRAAAEAEFDRQPLRITVRLPKGGSLTVQTNQESATAERTYPGALRVELFDWQCGQTYLAEVCLGSSSQKPLTFAIVCE